MERTISFSKGEGKASLRHNNRDFISLNVDRERIANNIILKQQDLGEAYEELFGKSQAEYNAKQKRNDRKIQDYFQKLFGKSPTSEIIEGENGKKSYYEFVVGIGNMHDTGYATNYEAAKLSEKCLLEYAKGFQGRNPNLYTFNLVLHADESDPHLHVDFIPFAEGYKRGMSRQQSYDRALEQMGKTYEKFCRSERQVLREICEKYGFEIAPEKESRGVTLSKEAYAELDNTKRENVRLHQENVEVKAKNETLRKEYVEMQTKITDIQQQLIEAQNKLILESQIPPRPVKPEPPEPVKKRICGTREELKENARELKQYEKTLKHYETKIIPAYEKELAAWEKKYLSVENAQRLATELENEKKKVSAVSAQQTETEKNQNAKAAQQAKVEKEQAAERRRLLEKEQALDGREKQLEAASATRARYEAEQLLKRQGYVPKTNGHQQALKFNERNSNYEHSNNKNRTDFNFSK